MKLVAVLRHDNSKSFRRIFRKFSEAERLGKEISDFVMLWILRKIWNDWVRKLGAAAWKTAVENRVAMIWFHWIQSV